MYYSTRVLGLYKNIENTYIGTPTPSYHRQTDKYGSLLVHLLALAAPGSDSLAFNQL